MTQKRLALAGGFGGDGGSLLDRLIDKMYATGNAHKVHPIFALHFYHDHFPVYFSIDLKVEACKKILLASASEGLLNRDVGELQMVTEDFPTGYLTKALDDMQISDFEEWLKTRTASCKVVQPRFGEYKL